MVNAVWYPGLNPVTEGDNNIQIGEIQINSLVNGNVLIQKYCTNINILGLLKVTYLYKM